jgi:hypothetical protein
MAPDSDHLDELRARLKATQEAAEQIAGRIPPQGWASHHHRDSTAGEVQALINMVHGLRDLVPEDLVDQVREILRQLLLLLRAILDLVVERLAPDRAPGEGRGPGGEPAIQDIPIT